MEYIFGAISIISLAISAWTYRKLQDAVKPVYIDVTVEPIIEPEEPEVVAEIEPAQPVKPAVVQEVYQGWRNQKGIPAYEPISPPPAPVAQPKVRGPLERPDGFV